MVELPDDVEKWDLGLLVNLLHQGFDESKILEFKSAINPDATNISKTVCAFANTDGGFFVLGINNDREQQLTFDQRLVGVEDSDDLKSKITAQITNITPDLLVKNIIFKNSNIKLDNGKVIVILKVLKSNNKPHQFEHKFFKRIPNGNKPMDVKEVRDMILESQKREHNEILLLLELSMLRDSLVECKKCFKNNDYGGAMGSLSYLDLTSTIHFQHELSYLYSIDIPSNLETLIHQIKRLSDIPIAYESTLRGEDIDYLTEEAKKKNYDDPKQYVKDILLTRVNTALDSMQIIESVLGHKIPKTRNMKKPIKSKHSSKEKS